MVTLGVRVSTKQRGLGPWLKAEFQQLGPTFIKIGQFISSRRDIFGEELSASFADLQDRVAPLDSAGAQEMLGCLRQRAGARIIEIDAEPFAAASIGQLHRAVTADGRTLAVKLKRPGIERILRSDLDMLRGMANVMVAAGVENGQSTVDLLEEIAAFLVAETDFISEVRNIQHFGQVYAENGEVQVPRVMPELSCKRIIVMEYVPDMGLATDRKGRALQARQLMTFFVQQVIDTGIIHGDPHPGNIGFSAAGKVVLYDFGNMITMTREERFAIKELVYLLAAGNTEEIIALLPAVGVTVVDAEGVRAYIAAYLQYVRTLDIGVFSEVVGTSNTRLPLVYSGRIFRVLRVFGTLEGMCKELDPAFNYFTLLDTMASSLVLDEEFLMHKVTKDLKRVLGG
ncbi:hypothetical protein HXX76_014142 [Chlamydomonas incerta]|uniref:ABC1 atypical kinase-like domain-containing protein n=1 Tax=Chlamydomonas incerta TaxID=51695 RepID=A0A835SMI6_CHLIN|nr:hypothetical protein HXX76_014142 [Chlamydomonas incerta]|eukprot:KAG2424984.1 hypothetical protein HXX76_014142 [Chlamydomonas incerta]